MTASGSDPGAQPTEEELRAAYEEQLKRVRVDDVLVQTILSLINLGGLRAGLVPGSEGERDAEQLHQAIEGVRALLPIVEPSLGPDVAAIRDAVSRLQMAYAQIAQAPEGGAGQETPPASETPKPGEPGPAQRSGRLWTPGS